MPSTHNFRDYADEPVCKNGYTIVEVPIYGFFAKEHTVAAITRFIQELSVKYKVKYLGPPRRYLGWTVKVFYD